MSSQRGQNTRTMSWLGSEAIPICAQEFGVCQISALNVEQCRTQHKNKFSAILHILARFLGLCIILLGTPRTLFSNISPSVKCVELTTSASRQCLQTHGHFC